MPFFRLFICWGCVWIGLAQPGRAIPVKSSKTRTVSPRTLSPSPAPSRSTQPTPLLSDLPLPQPEPPPLPAALPPPVAATAPPSRSASSEYTVVGGDTLWKISRRFSVSVDTLKAANQLSSHLIQPGQILKIPISKPAEPEKIVQQAPAPQPPLETLKTSSLAPVQTQMEETPVRVRYGMLKERFLAETRRIGRHNVDYNEAWRPPEKDSSWVMDCSNTSRYLYQRVANVDIGRTASDQYYFLKEQDRAWDVPLEEDGFADKRFLEKNLQIGDLLFWEHTYRPKRTPPITHVMIFLGKNEEGKWIMAGSQTGNGILRPKGDGGPDLYYFQPGKYSGGYKNFFGSWVKRGRFVAFGRPIGSIGAELVAAAAPPDRG
jgi:LysM repeat protein